MSGVVQHCNPGGDGWRALLDRTPEIVRTHLTDEGSPNLTLSNQTPQQIDVRGQPIIVQHRDQRQTDLQVGAVSGSDPRAPAQLAEDLDRLAIVASKFERDETLARQQVETGNECLAGLDQVGSTRGAAVGSRSPVE